MKFTRKTKMCRYYHGGSWHFQYFGQLLRGTTYPKAMGMWVEHDVYRRNVWFDRENGMANMPVLETKTVDGEIK